METLAPSKGLKMPLGFPQRSDDIRLARSPLTEVVCQVRFPPILKIPETKPVDFQEQVRERFPEFETEQRVMFQVDISSGGQLPPAGPHPVSKVYKFVSPRRRASTVILAENFFALSTTRYIVWEEFAKDLALVTSAFMAVYKPAYSDRIGLRYVNVLDPERLALSSLSEVVDLVQPALTCAFQTTAWQEPEEMINHLLLEDGDARLALRYGIVEKDEKASFALDFDYFQENQELPLIDVVARCTHFHAVIYDAFRWSIKDERLQVFEPMSKKEAQVGADHGSPLR
jgi:uncharacterized protein (TIGR04255 family)